jgi:hypothetical protein
VDNRISRNRIEHNPRADVLLANTEDLPATGNRFEANRFAANGVDLANISADRAPASDTFMQPSATTLPDDLAAQLSKGCAGASETIRLVAIDGDRLPSVSVPDGANFLKVGAPKDQPTMPMQPTPTTPLPDAVTMPTIDDIALPRADLLAERSGTR